MNRYDNLYKQIEFVMDYLEVDFMEGYCVKCKAKREMSNAKEQTMKNGRKAMKGQCPRCGTGMYRILGK